jgi:hypothetical protein
MYVRDVENRDEWGFGRGWSTPNSLEKCEGENEDTVVHENVRLATVYGEFE